MLMLVEVMYLLTTCIHVIILSLETIVDPVEQELIRRGNIYLVQLEWKDIPLNISGCCWKREVGQ